jgi:hypothetical protein
MLLRQALEQTRAGMPTPVQFNSRIAVLDHIDEVSAIVQKDVFDVHFHTVHNGATIRSFLCGSAGQVRQGQPHRKAATVVTGAQAS